MQKTSYNNIKYMLKLTNLDYATASHETWITFRLHHPTQPSVDYIGKSALAYLQSASCAGAYAELIVHIYVEPSVQIKVA